MSNFPPGLLRRFRRHAARVGADREPIELPELDALTLLPVLPGETPPQVPDRPLNYYSPDGEPFDGSFFEVMDQYGAARLRPDSLWRSSPFYRAGTRLTVSTVYLGLDHGWGGVPLIWESMVFHGGRPGRLGGAGSQQWRYATRAAARAGHVAIVTAIREGQRARRAAWKRTAPTRSTKSHPCHP